LPGHGKKGQAKACPFLGKGNATPRRNLQGGVVGFTRFAGKAALPANPNLSGKK
jgi:hypothetical protein